MTLAPCGPGGIPGEPEAIRSAAEMLADNSKFAEAILDDINSAQRTALGGWSAPSADGFRAITSDARAAAVGLIDVGPAVARILREYAHRLEAATAAFARAARAAEEAEGDLRSAESERAERRAESELDDARADMGNAGQAALAANMQAAAEIRALTEALPAIPQGPAPAPSGQPAGDGDPGANLWAAGLGLTGKGLDAYGGAIFGAGHAASLRGRRLSTGQSRGPVARKLLGRNPPSAAVRSTAARELPRAAGTAKTISRFAKPLPVVAPVVDFAANTAEGHGVGESLGRTAISGGLAAGTGLAAGAACGAVTFGLAAAACGAAGAVGGSLLGDELGDFFFGD